MLHHWVTEGHASSRQVCCNDVKPIDTRVRLLSGVSREGGYGASPPRDIYRTYYPFSFCSLYTNVTSTIISGGLRNIYRQINWAELFPDSTNSSHLFSRIHSNACIIKSHFCQQRRISKFKISFNLYVFDTLIYKQCCFLQPKEFVKQSYCIRKCNGYNASKIIQCVSIHDWLLQSTLP